MSFLGMPTVVIVATPKALPGLVLIFSTYLTLEILGKYKQNIYIKKIVIRKKNLTRENSGVYFRGQRTLYIYLQIDGDSV